MKILYLGAQVHGTINLELHPRVPSARATEALKFYPMTLYGLPWPQVQQFLAAFALYLFTKSDGQRGSVILFGACICLTSRVFSKDLRLEPPSFVLVVCYLLTVGSRGNLYQKLFLFSSRV